MLTEHEVAELRAWFNDTMHAWQQTDGVPTALLTDCWLAAEQGRLNADDIAKMGQMSRRLLQIGIATVLLAREDPQCT